MAEKSLYDQNLPHDELKYKEHFQRGLDFIKIELYRSARGEFIAALSYKPNDEASRERAEACKLQIKQDAKKVYILVPIVLAVIVLVGIFG